MSKPRQDHLPTILAACDSVGQFIEFWGFSRHMGRVWTLLYLSPRPFSAAKIQQELSISAGTASTVLRELLRWGVVHKLWQPGERRDYFQAETDLWKMVSRVVQERESRRITEVRESLETALNQMDSSLEQQEEAEERELTRFQLGRLEELLELCRSAEGLLHLLLETQHLDVSELDRDLGTELNADMD